MDSLHVIRSLAGADLRGADLRGADLTGADLHGADLTPEWVTPLLMLLDQPGKVRAYKLVTKEGQGPMRGGLTYIIGQSYSVDNANCDVTKDCGAGINLATLDWCLRNWQPGYKVMIAEFTAEDIAAVPTATDGKFRVHRCRIVAEKDVTGLVPKMEEGEL